MDKNRKLLIGAAAVLLMGAGLFLFGDRQPAAPSSSTVQGEEPAFYSGVSYAMNTFIEQKWYGPQAQELSDHVNAAIAEIEGQISSHLTASEIARLNANAGIQPVEVSERTFALLQRAQSLSQASQGAFDLTIGPLVAEWDITGDYPHVPTQEEIDADRSLIDCGALVLDESAHTAYLPQAGMAVDLGGIAKGWTADQLRQVALENGAVSGYVSLGGNLMIIGEKPDGSDYRFGVRDPRGDATQYLGIVTLPGKTMATTGDYERYFEQDGVRYHHVLDPRTGYPADGGLISVSVISEDGTLADYLSTTLFVLGKETALEALNASDAFGLILVDKDKNVYLSDSLKPVFTPHDEAGVYHFVGLEDTGEGGGA